MSAWLFYTIVIAPIALVIGLIFVVIHYGNKREQEYDESLLNEKEIKDKYFGQGKK